MNKSGPKLLSRRKFTFAAVLYSLLRIYAAFDRQPAAEVRGKNTVNLLHHPDVTSGASAALLCLQVQQAARYNWL
jgi:hypothetical protein